MELLWKDIRYALHSLRVNPGFAAIAILTLALGIGATTAIFTVVNAVLLQPLPLRDPDRLIVMREYRINADTRAGAASPANFREWAKQKQLFSSVGSTFDWEVTLTGVGDAELLRGGLVNGALFPTLGARPYLGRVLVDDDATEAAEARAVLSYALWQRKFGGDPKIVGRVVRLNGEPCTIVGVMAREFLVPGSTAELWVPYVMPTEPRRSRGRYLTAIARLAPGVTFEQAEAGMKVVSARLAAEEPQFNANFAANLTPVHEMVVGDVRHALLIVFAAVGLLLLIGCVNIANLLLSRATARSKEMAVRAAIGASRLQLIRQLFVESLVLAAIAAVAGVVLAGWATMLLVRFTPQSVMLPRTASIAIDGRVLAATAIITVITAVLFGLGPAVEGSRTDLLTALKSATRGSSGDARGKRFRNLLVVAEVALATLLLVGAGLLIKSFSRLEGIDPGVKPDGVLTMRIVLSPTATTTRDQRQVVLQRILDEVRHVPGVTNAGSIVTLNMPFTDSLSRQSFIFPDRPRPKQGEEPSADIRPIAGDYFRAMGVTMLSGRMFDARNTAPEHAEIVVNEEFVKEYLPPGTNAVGQRVSVEWYAQLDAHIVGVVRSVRAAGLGSVAAPAIYLNYFFDPKNQLTLIIGTSLANPRAVERSIVTRLHQVDPLMPVDQVKPLSDLIAGTIARPRFNATMMTLFAVLGLLLASIGIYGVLSYSVAQRTHEVGIRMALGADPGDVLRLVVGDGAKVALIGVAAGVAASLPATHLLAALLYGVQPHDLQVFAGVAATLAAVALIASYVPARRATRVDPAIALRPE